ncbi:hypothetical protein BDR26DRAFT_864404, partial [Obelidium mucronatum]
MASTRFVMYHGALLAQYSNAISRQQGFKDCPISSMTCNSTRLIVGLYNLSSYIERELDILISSSTNCNFSAGLAIALDLEMPEPLLNAMWHRLYKSKGLFGLDACVYIFLASAVITALTMAALLYFLVAVEDRKGTKIMTPFNTSLIGGSHARLTMHYSNTRHEIVYGIAINLFQATGEWFYVKYSWARSEKQIKTMFPKSFRGLKELIRWSPVAFYSQLIGPIWMACIGGKKDVLEVLRAYLASQLLAGGVVLVLDVVFLTCFVKYLSRTKAAEDDTVEPRFLIISKYGLLAAAMCGFALGVLVCYSVLKLMNFSDDILDKIEILRGICVLCLSLIFVILVAMKIALYKHSLTEQGLEWSMIRGKHRESGNTVVQRDSNGDVAAAAELASKAANSHEIV